MVGVHTVTVDARNSVVRLSGTMTEAHVLDALRQLDYPV